jgi:Holliday junction resolvase RusA-like endonuclease
MIELTILGTPVAKGRPRVCKWGTYTPEKTVNYETLVKEMFIISKQSKLNGALAMDIRAFFPIVKSTSKKNRQLMIDQELLPTKKPDIDNIIKILTDSLNGLAYDDDSQIVMVLAQKSYSEEPRVELTIRELD